MFSTQIKAALCCDVLSVSETERLARQGVVVLPPLVGPEQLEELARAYDDALAAGRPPDLRARPDSVRLNSLVNYSPAFDALYVAEDLLRLATRVVGEPVRLAYLLARTLLPGAGRDRLHRDPWRADLKLAAFIVPIDDFREDNGATRFIPGSHRGNLRPEAAMDDPAARHPQEWIAVAPAGSCILYDGDVWHGYTANRSRAARRSLQGGFIPWSSAEPSDGHAALTPETMARLSTQARAVFALDQTC
jgi:hypothetical protein